MRLQLPWVQPSVCGGTAGSTAGSSASIFDQLGDAAVTGPGASPWTGLLSSRQASTVDLGLQGRDSAAVEVPHVVEVVVDATAAVRVAEAPRRGCPSRGTSNRSRLCPSQTQRRPWRGVAAPGSRTTLPTRTRRRHRVPPKRTSTQRPPQSEVGGPRFGMLRRSRALPARERPAHSREQPKRSSRLVRRRPRRAVRFHRGRTGRRFPRGEETPPMRRRGCWPSTARARPHFRASARKVGRWSPR